MLEIFPASSLDNSILTPVLVGLFVVWFFQETLGWNFSGLIVPGYLASVLVVQPLTGLVITVECVATWGLVWLVSEVVPVTWYWSRLFGRDRFFAVCLASVIIRLLLEGGGLQLLQGWTGSEPSAALHSMGLLVVPLGANALWRSGLVAGVPRLGIPVAITWAILEFGLLRFTNLSLASFELTYEQVALDFVSSPRAYMLLLLGAWLGSEANLRFGWDFGGLIIPGLLAVCWLEPMRVFATLGEAWVIAGLLAAARRMPLLRTANLGGGRLLVLGFSLAYALRFGLAWALPFTLSGWPVQDLFGFGYLLSTLMALRIHAHGEPFRSTIPALLTSTAAFFLATTLGLAAALIAPPPRDVLDSEPVPTELRPSTFARTAYDAGDRLTTTLEDWLSEGPGVRHGAEGIGTFWDRGSGSALTVSARVGTWGLGTTAQRIADELDARYVHLCPPTPEEGCERVRQALRAKHPVLIVTPGTDNVLVAGRTLPTAIDLPTLASLLDNLRLQPSQQRLELRVAPSPRLRLATTTAPLPLSPAAESPPSPTAEEERLPRTRDTLRWAHAELAAALADWREDTETAEASLAWAAETAAELSISIARSGPVVEVYATDLWVRLDQRGTDQIVWVPFAEAPDLLPFAAGWARVLSAGWLISDATPTLTAEHYPRHRLAQILLTGALDPSGGETLVTTVRGIRDIKDPSAEAVLSIARPLFPGRPRPHVVQESTTFLEQAGHRPRIYSADPQGLSFIDPGNPARSGAKMASGNESHVTLWVSTRLRRDLGTLTWRHPFESAVYQARLLETPFAIDEPDRMHMADIPAWAGPLIADLEAFRRVDVPEGLVEIAADARRQNARLEVGCDPWVGCRWFVLSKCTDEGGPDERCEGATLPLRRDRLPLAPPADSPVAQWILHPGPLGFVRMDTP